MQTIRRQVPSWFHCGFLILAAAFLYLDLFVLPATPIFVDDSDQLLHLHNATRMLDGQMIYRDFFQFVLPGTELVYLALFKLFGVRAWIPNVMLALLGLSLTWLCVFISRKLLSGSTAYLPGLLFLALAFHPVLDASHHWYSVLAVTAAIALVIEERSPQRVAGAAALCALAAYFTQARGIAAVVGLAVFLCWEHRKKRQSGRSLLKAEVILAGVFSAVIAGLNVYFVWTVGLKRFLWSTVTFGLKYYSAESLNNLQVYMPIVFARPHWYEVPGLLPYVFIHALLPLVYLLFFARCWRESQNRPEQPWDRLMLVSLLGFLLLAGVAPAPVYWRLCTVSLPALIIFVWFLSSKGKLQFLARQMLWLGAAVMLIGFTLQQQTKWRAYFNSPIGRVAFFEPGDYERYKWVSSHMPHSKFFFDCSGKAYFLLGLRSPTVVSFLTDTDYVRPEQVRNVIETLEEYRVTPLIWCTDLDPGVHGLHPGDHLGPLRDYLRSHYHAAETPEDALRVLERNDTPVTE